MIIAIIGSRSLQVPVAPYIPSQTTEMISGGAHGIDTMAEEYAKQQHIHFHMITPDYERYGRQAPLKRSIQIIEEADWIVAIWDGKSKGTLYTIEQAALRGKTITIKIIPNANT